MSIQFVSYLDWENEEKIKKILIFEDNKIPFISCPLNCVCVLSRFPSNLDTNVKVKM